MENKIDKEYWRTVWEKFKTGDHKAFETIYNEFADVMFSYGSRFTNDRSMLGDCLHDTFIGLYQSGRNLRKPESLEFYLLKSLKHNIFKKLKEKHRYNNELQITDSFDLKFSIENKEDNLTSGQTQKLQKEIQKLDSKKRELLFLRFNSGLTYKEIGKLLNLSPGAVKNQVYRILKFMRNRLGETFLELFTFITVH